MSRAARASLGQRSTVTLGVIALIAGVAGCGRRREVGPPPVIADAAVRATTVAPPRSTSPRPFVVGRVVVAARKDGRVVPLALDAATGTWAALGSGADHLFPTEVADGAAILVVAARGEREGEHGEQLAWVRGAVVEPLGPRAASIRNPTRAPSGALVFESSGHSFRDLYRLDGHAAAAEPRRLTDDLAGNFEPALAPDGRTVVFTSSRDGDAELYRMPAAGGRATRLTASAKDDWGARWSPDGRRLVFLSDREGAPRAFVMTAAGTELHRLTAETDPDVVEDAPRWSPDGTTIALVRGQASATTVIVHAADRRGAAPRTLTPAGASDTELAWSPDGRYLVVARHQPPPTAATVTFVRFADGAELARDPIEPLALRWYRPYEPP